MDSSFWHSSVYIKCGTGLHGTFRRFCTSRKYRNYERLYIEYNFRSDFYSALGICGVGIPASIQNLLNVTGMTILNNFTSSFGADAVAAMGIVQKINQVPMQIAMGLSQGIMPLISYNYSSKNHKRMRKSLTFTAKISQGFLCTVAVAYFVFAENLVAMFMNNEVIIGYGTQFLRGFCISMPFLCMDFLFITVFPVTFFGQNNRQDIWIYKNKRQIITSTS